MDFRWEHHLVSMWHPGVLASIVAASMVAWLIGAAVTSLVLRVKDPWRRVVYLSPPVLLVALFVLFLPSLIFEVGWALIHPKWVQADLWAARPLLLIPLLTALVSSFKRLLEDRRKGSVERGAA